MTCVVLSCRTRLWVISIADLLCYSTARELKQSVVARNNAKAEFRDVDFEELWVEKVQQELKVSNSPWVPLLRTTQSYMIEKGQICISYVPTAEQSIDILTKVLPKKYPKNITSCAWRIASSQLQGEYWQDVKRG